MKSIRIGNDINVAWSLMRDDAPFLLDKETISLFLHTPFGRMELTDYSVEGNVISWVFFGKNQKAIGKYSLILVINKGKEGMITTDACDFVNLVSCSCKLQGGEDAPNVETESIELTSTLEYVAGGGDYDDTALWRALNGKVDKVEGLGLSEENYTTEDKEKLEGLENYDDSGIKEDLAKKAYKSEIPTKMSQLEQDIEIGGEVDLSDYPTREEVSETYLPREEFDERIEGYATHDSVQELSENVTELSAEVSGLSEKIENLPSGESSVFEAVYGETTYDEVVEAKNAGKFVICIKDRLTYHLSYVSEDLAYFTTIRGNVSYATYINKATNKWTDALYSLEQLSNKVTSLSSASTDTQYPSAKAVYEALQNVGGGSDVFEAVFNETTYDEILEAYNAGKIVVCKYYNVIYRLTYVTNIMHFAAQVNDSLMYVRCPQSNRWQQSTENTDHSLETLDNGNAQITIAGKSAEVATPQYVENAIQQSGTPSGDPMHYMFEAAGATYNATDADISMVGMYGDSYVHKAKHWHLAEIGDLTNEEIREIYSLTNPFRRRNVLECIFAYSTIRTNFPIWDDDNIGFGSFNKSRTLMNGLAYRARGLEVFNYVSPNIPITSNTNKYNGISEVSMFLYQANKLKKILGVLDVSYVASAIQESCFRDCSVLEELRIHSLKVSIVIKYSPMLSNASILYMIKNSAATSPIVITLHADAYARAMADTEIQAALEAHPNVSLASA